MNKLIRRSALTLAALLSVTVCISLAACNDEVTEPLYGSAVTMDADRFSDYPMGRIHNEEENTDLNVNASSLMIGSADVEVYRLGNTMIDTVLSEIPAESQDEVQSLEEKTRQDEINAAREEAARRAEEEAKRKEAERKRKEAEEKRREEERKKREAEEAKRAACPGYSPDFVSLLTPEEQAEAQAFYDQGYVFYRQNWSYLKNLPYGDEGFGQCGCGPTCVAAVISNLAGVPVTPEDMRVWGLEHGSWLAGGGTTYDFMISTPKRYGIKATSMHAADRAGVETALREGKLILVCMGPGDFTLGAHFMLYRGITDDGDILIADSYSYEFSAKPWKWEDLYAQLKSYTFWVFEPDTDQK